MDRINRNILNYFKEPIPIHRSSRQNKKYYIVNPQSKAVHFGDDRYEDFTQHRDKKRQQNYLARATNIKGSWRQDKYSPNNLSIHLLWM